MALKFFCLLACMHMALSASTGSTETLSNGKFTTDLFNHVLQTSKYGGNLIFSPASIHTCLALAFFGAEDKTASEMVSGLHLETQNKEQIAHQFEKMLELTRGPKALMKIANKIYANKGYEIKPEFNDVAKKSFGSEAQTLDFSKTEESIRDINSWVESNTNNKIKNLVDNSIVNADASMVLVNAIHFSGKWMKTMYVSKGDFFNGGTTEKKIDMMHIDTNFPYAEVNDLNAVAVELPYKDTDLTMMIILPKDKTGLNIVEAKLKDLDLIELSKTMQNNDVTLTMPKFQIESTIEMNEILISMGMQTMFTDSAKFNFFKTPQQSRISKVVHKAFIDVNEEGTEAGGATAIGIVPTSLNLNQKYFNADHPFFFAIKDKTNIYFTGHVVNL